MRKVLQRQKNDLKKVVSMLNRKPLLCVPIVALISGLLFVAIEQARAEFFIKNAEDYRNSATVQTLLSDIDTLNRSVLVAPAAYFCNLDLENLLPDFNNAYLSLGQGNNAPDAVMSRIRSDIELTKNVPYFHSYLTVLPTVERAHLESKELNSALARLRELSAENERSEYCQSLQEILGRTYFIESIRKPEGVSALFPGQIENFQINLSQAQEALDALPAIDNSIEVHAGLRRALSSLSLILKGDENNYVMFSRAVEEQYTEIESLLESLRSKNQDLQDIPAQLALAIVDLQ